MPLQKCCYLHIFTPATIAMVDVPNGIKIARRFLLSAAHGAIVAEMGLGAPSSFAREPPNGARDRRRLVHVHVVSAVRDGQRLEIRRSLGDASCVGEGARAGVAHNEQNRLAERSQDGADVRVVALALFPRHARRRPLHIKPTVGERV